MRKLERPMLLLACLLASGCAAFALQEEIDSGQSTVITSESVPASVLDEFERRNPGVECSRIEQIEYKSGHRIYRFVLPEGWQQFTPEGKLVYGGAI